MMNLKYEIVVDSFVMYVCRILYASIFLPHTYESQHTFFSNFLNKNWNKNLSFLMYFSVIMCNIVIITNPLALSVLRANH